MWVYRGKIVETIDTNEFCAFVYKITNKTTNKFYIGYKQTTFSKFKQIKKKKKRIFVESDWRDYWSSCLELQADVALLGEDNFEREIIFMCMSKSMAKYLEIRLQLDLRVLENPLLSYNRIINARVAHNHLKKHLEHIKKLST